MTAKPRPVKRFPVTGADRQPVLPPNYERTVMALSITDLEADLLHEAGTVEYRAAARAELDRRRSRER